jgi:Flp pilus assembly pilin Flp
MHKETSMSQHTPESTDTAAPAPTVHEQGQASVEYALVLLGAAVVASLLIAWATKTDLLDQLFDHVLSLIKGKAK